MFVFALK